MNDILTQQSNHNNAAANAASKKPTKISDAPKHAMEMLLTGDMISAAKAREIGLINRVVEREELSSAVELLAEQIAHKSSSAIRIGKRTLWQQSAMDIRDAYSLAGTTMVDNMGTSDAREGISAFLQKREPEWRG